MKSLVLSKLAGGASFLLLDLEPRFAYDLPGLLGLPHLIIPFILLKGDLVFLKLLSFLSFTLLTAKFVFSFITRRIVEMTFLFPRDVMDSPNHRVPL